MSLLLELSVSSSIVQELDSNGAIDLSPRILVNINNSSAGRTPSSTNLFVYTQQYLCTICLHFYTQIRFVISTGLFVFYLLFSSIHSNFQVDSLRKFLVRLKTESLRRSSQEFLPFCRWFV